MVSKPNLKLNDSANESTFGMLNCEGQVWDPVAGVKGSEHMPMNRLTIPSKPIENQSYSCGRQTILRIYAQLRHPTTQKEQHTVSV